LSDDANNLGPARDRLLLLGQDREAYGRVAYTHKTHEKQADILDRKTAQQQRIRVALTVLSSGAFLSSFAGLFLAKPVAALVISFIALLVSASTLGTKTFRYGEQMQQHSATAVQLWDLRESYLSLIVALMSSTADLPRVAEERDRLQKVAAKIYSDAPRTSSQAYAAAQQALQLKEDLTFSNEEINLLLPTSLRYEADSP
jgi:hypothetical protein